MARTKRAKSHRIRPSWRVARQLASLNPIEQVWGYMKAELERSKPRSIPALKRKIQQIWANVDADFVQKQADGMQKRLKSIIKSGGDFTGN